MRKAICKHADPNTVSESKELLKKLLSDTYVGYLEPGVKAWLFTMQAKIGGDQTYLSADSFKDSLVKQWNKVKKMQQSHGQSGSDGKNHSQSANTQINPRFSHEPSETCEQNVLRMLSELPANGGQEHWQQRLQKLRENIGKRTGAGGKVSMNARQWADAWSTMQKIEQEMKSAPVPREFAKPPLVDKPVIPPNTLAGAEAWEVLKQKPLDELLSMLNDLMQKENIESDDKVILDTSKNWIRRGLMDNSDWKAFAKIVEKYPSAPAASKSPRVLALVERRLALQKTGQLTIGEEDKLDEILILLSKNNSIVADYESEISKIEKAHAARQEKFDVSEVILEILKLENALFITDQERKRVLGFDGGGRNNYADDWVHDRVAEVYANLKENKVQHEQTANPAGKELTTADFEQFKILLSDQIQLVLKNLGMAAEETNELTRFKKFVQSARPSDLSRMGEIEKRTMEIAEQYGISEWLRLGNKK